MNFSEVKKKLETDSSVVLLDVRTHNEYIQKHIPKSILIPVDILASEVNKRLPDQAAEIFVYCASGSRSRMAVNILKRLGYTNVYDLGGIASWPYETASGSK